MKKGSNKKGSTISKAEGSDLIMNGRYGIDGAGQPYNYNKNMLQEKYTSSLPKHL